MSLEKQISVDLIEVTENGVVQVRTATKVIEDGVMLGGSLHRHSVAPGDNYSKEDTRVQGVCAALHTAEVIAAYKAATAAKGV